MMSFAAVSASTIHTHEKQACSDHKMVVFDEPKELCMIYKDGTYQVKNCEGETVVGVPFGPQGCSDVLPDLKEYNKPVRSDPIQANHIVLKVHKEEPQIEVEVLENSVLFGEADICSDCDKSHKLRTYSKPQDGSGSTLVNTIVKFVKSCFYN